VSDVYLQHGDFHFNNLLFKDEGDQMKVMIVDWQLTYTGRSTGDVSYLIMSSLSQDVRHKYGQELKEDYFKALNRYLKTLESSVLDHMSQNTCGISFSIECDSSEPNIEVDVNKLENDYQDSSTLSLFLSCGNVLPSEPMSRSHSTSELNEQDCEEASVTLAYDLVKEAEYLQII